MEHLNSPGVVAFLYSLSGKEALDVASDEALSCRRRAWDVP